LSHDGTQKLLVCAWSEEAKKASRWGQGFWAGTQKEDRKKTMHIILKTFSLSNKNPKERERSQRGQEKKKKSKNAGKGRDAYRKYRTIKKSLKSHNETM